MYKLFSSITALGVTLAATLAPLTATAQEAAPAKPALVVKPGAYLQADGVFFFEDEGEDAYVDQFLLKRVRPTLRATAFDAFHFRLLFDVAGGALALLDANVELAFAPEVRLRVGKMKGPVSIERLQSATALTFYERALPTLLAPNRDVGAELLGDLFDGVLSYEVGVFDGAPDGQSVDVDADDPFDVHARVFAQPFVGSDVAALKGLGVGLAGTVGTARGSATATQLSSYRSTGRRTFFRYADGVHAWGSRQRLAPQLSWYAGPVGLLGEAIWSKQEVRGPEGEASITHFAWQAAASVALTGHAASPRGLSPTEPFAPSQGQWGAVELAARVTGFEADQAAFTEALAHGASARSALAYTLGVNWYLNPHVKAQLDFERTAFESPAGVADLATESALLSRLQFAF